MTDKPEILRSGRFKIEANHCDTYYLFHNNIPIAQTRLSEFQQLAKEILKDEIDQLEEDRDYWCEEYYCEFINNDLER